LTKTILKYILPFIIISFICSTSFSQNTVGKLIYEIDDINIKFTGLKTYEESDLKNLLASKSGVNFDLETYMKDVERLKKYYFDNGFFDAEVDTNLVINKKDEEIDLNFIIKQNTRYTYYDIEYKGLDSIEESVRKLVNKPEERLMNTGKYYSKDTIKLEVTRVLNILYNNGYATAKA
jgi:outer membrane protein assembly factor BamA